MKTVTVELFKIDELSPAAKEKALETHKDINNDFFGDDFKEYMKEALESKGLPSSTEFSLSYSQGDGVAFYGVVDVMKFLSAHKLKTYFRNLHALIEDGEIDIKIGRNQFGYHYSHWNTMSVQEYSYLNLSEKRERLLSELVEIISDKIKALSKEFEKTGYEWLEENEKEENIIETFKANDYDFTASGEMWG